MVDFSDYAAVLTRNLTACVREPTTFLAVLMVQLDGSARLEFIQVRSGMLCVQHTAALPEHTGTPMPITSNLHA